MATRLYLAVNRNVWKGIASLTPWGLLEGHDSAAPRSHDNGSDWPKVCFVLPGALNVIGPLIIIRWYCADMIVSFECSHSSTFGDVRVVNGVRTLNQR